MDVTGDPRSAAAPTRVIVVLRRWMVRHAREDGDHVGVQTEEGPLPHPLVASMREQQGRPLRQPRCWTGAWLVHVYPTLLGENIPGRRGASPVVLTVNAAIVAAHT